MANPIPITPALAEFWQAMYGETDLSYEEIQERGGPSQPTLTKLTKGEGSLSAESARRLEDAMGLERGSLRRVANGGKAQWKPEGAPGAPIDTVGYTDREDGRFRTPEFVSGFQHAEAWAHLCWRMGLSREQYHRLSDEIFSAYEFVAALTRPSAGSVTQMPTQHNAPAELAAKRGRVQPSEGEEPR